MPSRRGWREEMRLSGGWRGRWGSLATGRPWPPATAARLTSTLWQRPLSCWPAHCCVCLRFTGEVHPEIPIHDFIIVDSCRLLFSPHGRFGSLSHSRPTMLCCRRENWRCCFCFSSLFPSSSICCSPSMVHSRSRWRPPTSKAGKP